MRVQAEVRPTEAQEKVEAAIKEIFPTLELARTGDLVIGESTDVSSLSKLYQRLRQQTILDSARSMMLARRQGASTQIILNKQVAFIGKVNFTNGGSPLGPIVVTLEAPDLERLIDYLAPRTREGKPIHEITY